jgi:hypothetical protein
LNFRPHHHRLDEAVQRGRCGVRTTFQQGANDITDSLVRQLLTLLSEKKIVADARLGPLGQYPWSSVTFK